MSLMEQSDIPITWGAGGRGGQASLKNLFKYMASPVMGTGFPCWQRSKGQRSGWPIMQMSYLVNDLKY